MRRPALGLNGHQEKNICHLYEGCIEKSIPQDQHWISLGKLTEANL